jgi:hypothetical protein
MARLRKLLEKIHLLVMCAKSELNQSNPSGAKRVGDSDWRSLLGQQPREFGTGKLVNELMSWVSYSRYYRNATRHRSWRDDGLDVP